MPIEKFENCEFERIAITVPSSGAVVTPDPYYTKSGHKEIFGIGMSCADEAALPGTTMQMSIDNKEVFNNDFEPRMIYANSACPVNERFFNYINRKIDKAKIDIRLTDATTATAYPYKIYLYLMVNSVS